MLGWLTGGRFEFASIGSPYDIVRLPDFEFPIEAPQAAYIARLKTSFPGETAAIDAYFAACGEAQRASFALMAARALPTPIAAVIRWLNAARATCARITRRRGARFPRRTPRGGTCRALGRLRAAARHPFAVHALVTGSYSNGAYYPVGGPAKFAAARRDSPGDGR